MERFFCDFISEKGKYEIIRWFVWSPHSKDDSLHFETKEMEWTCGPRWALKDGNPKNYMTITVECENKNKSVVNWSCDAEIEMIVMRTKIRFIKFVKKNEYHFTDDSPICNFGKFYSFENPLLRKHKLTVIVAVHIKSTVEGGKEFSIPRNIDTEVVLRFRDQALYVDKYALLCFSSFFREILLNETNVDEIDVTDDVDLKHVTKLLRFLYGRQQDITEHNSEGLLKLANKYDVQCLLACIEDFLISTDSFTIPEKLELAELYNLAGLQSEMRGDSRKSRNEDVLIETPTLDNGSSELSKASGLEGPKSGLQEMTSDDIEIRKNKKKSRFFNFLTRFSK